MSNKILAMLLIGTSLSMASSAFAADLVANAADVEQASAANPFDGLYIGVHGGWSQASTDEDADGQVWFDSDTAYGFGADFTNDLSGFVGGVQIGANSVTDAGLVLGVELGADIGSVTGTRDLEDGVETWWNSDALDLDNGPWNNYSTETTIDQAVNAKIKAGFAVDQFMLYGSAGLAVANVHTEDYAEGDYCYIDCDPPFDMTAALDTWRVGWTVGAGAEFMVSDRISVFASYDYADFGALRSAALDVPYEDWSDEIDRVDYSKEVSLTQQTVTFGLNLHM